MWNSNFLDPKCFAQKPINDLFVNLINLLNKISIKWDILLNISVPFECALLSMKKYIKISRKIKKIDLLWNCLTKIKTSPSNYFEMEQIFLSKNIT